MCGRPFVHRRARLDREPQPQPRCALEDGDVEVHGMEVSFGAATPAENIALGMDKESDSSEDVVVEGIRKGNGQFMTGPDVWDEYLAMEAKDSRLPW